MNLLTRILCLNFVNLWQFTIQTDRTTYRSRNDRQWKTKGKQKGQVFILERFQKRVKNEDLTPMFHICVKVSAGAKAK